MEVLTQESLFHVENLEGLIAEATIENLVHFGYLATRNYGKNKKNADRVLQQIQKRFSTLGPEKDLFLCPKYEVSEISLITNVCNKGPNLTLFLSYVLLTALCKKVTKVHVILSAELMSNLWSSGKQRIKLIQYISDTLITTANRLNFPAEILDKIKIFVAPKPNEYANLLLDVCFRYEGHAYKNKTRMAEQYIYRNSGVLAGVSSSLIKDLSEVDIQITPVRNESGKEGTSYFVPPLLSELFPEKTLVDSNLSARNIVLSIYSGTRIELGLRQIEDWSPFESLFEEVPNFKWVLVGASDCDTCISSFEPNFYQKYSERIEVLPFSDLASLFSRAIAFLALPNVTGGAGGAARAVLNGVPLVYQYSVASDICTMFENPSIDNNLSDVLRRLKEIILNENSFVETLEFQYADLKLQHDWELKSRQLYDLYRESHRKFLARRKKLTKLGFLHVQKCGGTALVEKLNSNFRQNKNHISALIKPSEVSQSRWAIVEKSREWHFARNNFFLSGHIFFNDLKKLDREFIFTVLRDPYERIFSLFTYDVSRSVSEVSRRNDPNVDRFKGITFAEYFKTIKPNGISKLLLGDLTDLGKIQSSASEITELNANKLRGIIDRSLSRFDAIFDNDLQNTLESLSYNGLTDDVTIQYVNKSNTEITFTIGLTERQFIEQIESKIWLDKQVYTRACEMFAKTCKKPLLKPNEFLAKIKSRFNLQFN